MNPDINMHEFDEIVRNRRSTYPYHFEKGKKIPDAIIEKILGNANRAPTHKLTEPWRFTVFSDEGLSYFADLQTKIYTDFAGEKFKESKLKNLKEYPLQSSHVIVVGMKRSKLNIPEIEEVLAVGCAIENIYLSLSAYGLGGYLSTGGITYINEAKKYFGLEEPDKLVGIFYVGFIRDGLINPLSPRGAVSEKITWVRKS